MTLEQIAQRCKTEDREAQREMYEMLSPRMFCVVRRLVHDRAKAEDVLHDGFMHLFAKIGDFRGEGSFEGWARRVFVTTALTEIRKESKWGVMESDDKLVALPSTIPTVVERMNESELIWAIDTLPDVQRTVLMLYSVEGYSHEEIAAQLDITTQNSRIILHRAKARLAEILKDRA